MSTCISRHGEFGSHTHTDTPFVCDLCGVFDEDAAVRRITELEALVAKMKAPVLGDPGGFQVGFSFRCVTDEWHRVPMSGVDVEICWGGHTYDQQGRLIFTLLARRPEQPQLLDAPDGAP